MANYNAQHGEWIPVQYDNEDSTVFAPQTPIDGQWFGIKAVSAGTTGWSLTVDGNGNQIESPIGQGLSASQPLAASWVCYRWHFIQSAWRLTGQFKPATDVERFHYTGADIPVAGWTDIPLAYDTIFAAAPYFFTVEGGDLRCQHRFVGHLNLVAYAILDLTANNTDAKIQAQLQLTAGTAAWRQGHGLTAGTGGPRANQIPISLSMRVPAVVQPGALINYRATDDALQSGLTWIVNETAIAAETL